MSRAPPPVSYIDRMGLLDALRKRAEQPVTAATIDALNEMRPDLGARGVVAVCPEGHKHYSVALDWGAKAAIFVRCHPTVYIQTVTQNVADHLFRTQEPGASQSYITECAMYGFSEPFAAAANHPVRTAAEIAVAAPAPQRGPKPSAGAANRAPAAETPSQQVDTGRDQRSVEELVRILRTSVPLVSVRRLTTRDGSAHIAEVKLDERVGVRARAGWPDWRISILDIDTNGAWEELESLAGGFPPAALAVWLLNRLVSLGAEQVRGSADGFHRNSSYVGDDWDLFIKRFVQSVTSLAATATTTDDLDDAKSDGYWSPTELAGETMAKFLTTRPDIQRAMLHYISEARSRSSRTDQQS